MERRHPAGPGAVSAIGKTPGAGGTPALHKKKGLGKHMPI